VAQVDPDDDDQRRYVVFHHRYDPDRRERRPVLVTAFDDPVEFEDFLQRHHADLQARIRDGQADPREHLSGVLREPGDQRRARQQRMASRAMRHGVNPARLPDVDPGTADELAHAALLAEAPDTT
jgi:hypothetical protein